MHMHDLSALHQYIITMEDNSDDDDLLDLQDLLSKNKRHRSCHAGKIRCLHGTMVQEGLDFFAKLTIGTSINKITSSDNPLNYILM